MIIFGVELCLHAGPVYTERLIKIAIFGDTGLLNIREHWNGVSLKQVFEFIFFVKVSKTNYLETWLLTTMFHDTCWWILFQLEAFFLVVFFFFPVFR